MYRRKKASIIRKKKESGKKSPTRKCRKTLPSAFSPALKYLPRSAKGLDTCAILRFLTFITGYYKIGSWRSMDGVVPIVTILCFGPLHPRKPI